MCAKIKVILDDITQLKVDAIVNAANKTLLGGGGVDGAIHYAAGPKLLEACRKLNGCETGQAKITKGYNLPAKYVIHTVGPVYQGKPKEPNFLAFCYINCLGLAMENDIHTIAFPSISTGVYGYPKEKAVEIALTTVKKCLKEMKDYEIDIIFCCFDQETYNLYITKGKEKGLL